MNSFRDSLERAGRAGGATIAESLRAPGAAEALGARARSRRRRRDALGTAASIAALGLAAWVGTTIMNAPEPDPAGPVHRGDAPVLDRLVNPGAATLFECGVEPSGIPDRGVTIPVDADRDAHPRPEIGVFARYSVPIEGVTVRGLPLNGSVMVDPAAAVLFAATVAWEERETPEVWGLSTAGAVLDADGLPVMVHDGITVRGDLLPVVERRRAIEGGFSAYSCGDPYVGDGTHTIVVMLQVWVGDPSQPIATYVNSTLPEDPALVIREGPAEVSVTGDDLARREQSRLAQQVASEGVPLSEAGAGYGPAALIRSALADGTPSCRRAASAPTLDAIAVMPIDFDPTGREVGIAPIALNAPVDGPDAVEERMPVMHWEGDIEGDHWTADFLHGSDPDTAWASHLYRSTLILYDSSGAAVTVLEGEPSLARGESERGGVSLVKVFPWDPQCAVPADLPATPGTYTPVLVLDLNYLPGTNWEDGDSLEQLGLTEPPDAWFVLPDVEVAEPGSLPDLDLAVQAWDWSVLVL